MKLPVPAGSGDGAAIGSAGVKMDTQEKPAAESTPEEASGSLLSSGRSAGARCGVASSARAAPGSVSSAVQGSPGGGELTSKLDLGNSIERAKQEWEVAVDSLPGLVCVLDRHGKILRASRAVERWHLANVSDVRGMSLDELLHGRCDDPSCYLKAFLAEGMANAKRGRRSARQVDDTILERPLEIVLLPALASREGAQAHGSRIVAVAMVDDVSGTKRTEAALRQSESELRLLSAQLLAAQEIERKRIASELHDSIGASLSSIKFGLEQAIRSLPPDGFEQGHAVLQSLVQVMQNTIGEVRRISMDLRPASLDHLGLIATLSWFFREFGAIHPHMRIVKDVDVQEADVAPTLKTTIFRVVQEGVNNIVKHAGSNELRFRLKRRGREIELLLEDHGCGFDPVATLQIQEGRVRGLGLNSMRERVELSGGTFSLTSRPGAGTRLRATWPLHRMSAS